MVHSLLAIGDRIDVNYQTVVSIALFFMLFSIQKLDILLLHRIQGGVLYFLLMREVTVV